MVKMYCKPHFLIYLQKHLLLRIGAHLSIGLVFGYLYAGVGSKADSVFANYVYLYGTTLFLVYTGKMAVTLSCKLCLEYNSYLRTANIVPSSQY
jgi:hypothetical protein